MEAKKVVFNGEKERTHYSCEDGIAKIRPSQLPFVITQQDS